MSTLAVQELVVTPDDVAQRRRRFGVVRIGDERGGALATDVAFDLLEAGADVEDEALALHLIGEVDRVACRLVLVVDVADAGVQQAVAAR